MHLEYIGQLSHELAKSRRLMLPVCLILACMLISGCSPTNKTLKRNPFPRSKTQHTVVYGDTLYSIAYRSGTSVKQLAQLNHFEKPYTLFPGQTVVLRPNSTRFNISSKHYKNQSRSHDSRGLKYPPSNAIKSPIAEISKKNLKISWLWPLTGIVVKDFNQTGRKGIDIAGKLGETILAAASGKVVYSGRGLLGYGNLIIIKHNFHFLTAYANNRNLFVKEGQAVRRGQIIAEVGVLSGKKPSLHFEIRRDGKPVNPLSYLPKR